MTARREDGADRPAPVRRERGRARIALILEAAATEFATVGYDRATTNSIAARAGISPGSLYQYFADKVAVARGLAEHYTATLVDSQAGASASVDPATPLAEVIDRVIDPLIAFNVENPAFLALFARADLPEEISGPVEPLEHAFAHRIGELLGVRNPHAPRELIERATRTAILAFRGLVAGISALGPRDRTARVAEIKAVIIGYLTHRGLR